MKLAINRANIIKRVAEGDQKAFIEANIARKITGLFVKKEDKPIELDKFITIRKESKN
jgi:hypothetical protein